jgi:hypothetical protein
MDDARRANGRATRLMVTTVGQRLLHNTFSAWIAAQKKSRALLGSTGVASLRRLTDPRCRETR